MKNVIKKISQAVQVLLLAPIKLPGKALNIIKYVAVGLGILESVLESDSQKEEPLSTDTGDTKGLSPDGVASTGEEQSAAVEEEESGQ